MKPRRIVPLLSIGQHVMIEWRVMGFGMVVCILVVRVHDFLFVYTVGGDDYNDDDCGGAVILHSLDLTHLKYYDNDDDLSW
jgi:hypothetical protein